MGKTRFQHSEVTVERSDLAKDAYRVTFRFWSEYGDGNDMHTRYVDAIVTLQKTYLNVSDYEGTDIDALVGNIERMQMGRIVADALSRMIGG